MRLMQLLAVSESPEGYKAVSQKLQEDFGEPVVTRRSGIIPMEQDAWEKLKRLHSG